MPAATTRSPSHGWTYDGRTALQTAREDEEAAQNHHTESEAALAAARIRLEELQNDPAMTSAKQLQHAEREAKRSRDDAEQAQRMRREAQSRLEREQQASRTRADRVEHAGRSWTDARAEAELDAERAGITAAYPVNPLATGDAAMLAALPPLALESARQDLRRAAAARREQVDLLLRRCEEMERATLDHVNAQARHDERRDEADDAAQRRELLTAGEREVLENHLQAEIASAVQKLLRDVERQINAINDELEKRPTSTGVRFRLQWQTLPEGAEGAPVGLEAARRRLLNTSTDLWSAEDRRVVGQMLQQRIAAERSRADAEQGGSLLEQLARALDYRRWHRFRVQRWQDGQWRPLAGPASSGERALGLTVPLFAAVSSYYSQAGTAHAPRLVLLDEAFAGIDDAARAHCMALIREFDLDFVITSEREWACYAELPGVAIAQLQRREGIDAVHVSRWTWDGRAKRREDDPDRRFPPAL